MSKHASADRTSARDRIIEAYLGLLVKKPTQESEPCSAVAKAAGGNRDTFYYYFSCHRRRGEERAR